MSDRKTIETTTILKTLPKEVLEGLAVVTRDDKAFKSLTYLLNLVAENDKDKIFRSAGGANSLDSLIDSGVNASFYRGRIASCVLVMSIIKNAARYLDKRSEKK